MFLVRKIIMKNKNALVKCKELHEKGIIVFSISPLELEQQIRLGYFACECNMNVFLKQYSAEFNNKKGILGFLKEYEDTQNNIQLHRFISKKKISFSYRWRSGSKKKIFQEAKINLPGYVIKESFISFLKQKRNDLYFVRNKKTRIANTDSIHYKLSKPPKILNDIAWNILINTKSPINLENSFKLNLNFSGYQLLDEKTVGKKFYRYNLSKTQKYDRKSKSNKSYFRITVHLYEDIKTPIAVRGVIDELIRIASSINSGDKVPFEEYIDDWAKRLLATDIKVK